MRTEIFQNIKSPYSSVGTCLPAGREQLPLSLKYETYFNDKLVRSLKTDASLAQLVEQLPFKETVAGSIPAGGTTRRHWFPDILELWKCQCRRYVRCATNRFRQTHIFVRIADMNLGRSRHLRHGGLSLASMRFRHCCRRSGCGQHGNILRVPMRRPNAWDGLQLRSRQYRSS